MPKSENRRTAGENVRAGGPLAALALFAAVTVAAPPEAAAQDVRPTAALVLSAPSISENGGVATVTATLSGASSAAATITVSADPAGVATRADFTLSTAKTLTIAAGNTTSTGVVTITAVDNAARLWGKSVRVSGTVNGDVRTPRFVTLGIVDDDAATVTLSLSPASISEGGGVATVTASLSAAENVATTVTVSAAAGSGATMADFTQTGTKLTIAANATASAGRVTIAAVNDDVDQASNKSVTVSGAVDGGGRADPASVTLTIEDNDDAVPTAGTSWRSTFLFNHLVDDWDVTTQRLLGKTASQPIAITRDLLTANGDVWACPTRTVPPPDRNICTNLAYDEVPSAISLTQAMIDNDGVVILIENAGTNYYAEWVPIVALPKATLAVSPSSISENGGVATVTATLDKAALSAATITVAAAPGANAAAGNFRLSGAALVFARGATSSAGAVTIAAVDDAIHSRARSVTVSGTAAGDVKAPRAVTLTIDEDDREPDVTLSLSSSSISEGGGVATVTAGLRVASGRATTIAVSAAAVSSSGAADGDFTLSSTNTLTIAAGATASVGAVTIAAVNDNERTANKRVTVSGRVTGGGLQDPASLTLTIADNDGSLPIATTWKNNAGAYSRSALDVTTASLVGKTASQPIGIVGDATLGSFDIYACADRRVAYTNGTFTQDRLGSACRRIGRHSSVPSTISLTQAEIDNDGVVIVFYKSPTAVLAAEWVPVAVPPNAALTLSASSIGENGGVATVTATLDKGALSPTTITVAVTPGDGAAASDVSLPATPELVFATGATASTGTVTITAVNNDADSPDKSVTVSGTVNGDAAAPPGVPLTLTDDDPLPTAALALSPASISENGGVASVTATLSRPSSEAVTLTVAAAPGAGAAAADFDLSAAKTLTIAAGNTASVGAVTVTANDNDVDAPDKQVTVSAAAAGGRGVAAPSNLTLTLEDDETPTVTLELSSSSIAENGGAATVTASLDLAPSAAVTVTVSASPGSGTDFTLSSTNALTIAAGATASAGVVTLTAADDDRHAPDRNVTVSGAASSGTTLVQPSDVVLTIADDEALPTLTLALSATSISETGGVTTVTATLSGKSGEALTATVAAAAGTGAAAADFALSTAKTLTIAAGATASAGVVTVTANGNDVDTADKSVTISVTLAGGHGVAAPSDLTLTLTDDDTAGVTFTPTALTLTEEGSGKNLTLVLDSEPPAGQTTWVGIYPDIGLQLEGSHGFPQGINYSFTASDWNTAQTVSVNALADADHQDGTLRLRYVVAGYGLGDVGQGVAHAQRPVAVTVTVEDDDKPVVTLALSASSISETGGVATVTATLDKAASEATTVTVAAAGTGAAAADFDLSATNTLTIAAGATASAGTVTVTANGNDVHSGDKSVTVSATADGGDGASDPDDVTLTLADDESLPTVTLALSESSISEQGGEATVTATLSGKSSEATTVTVRAAAGTGAAAADFDLSAANTLTIAAGSTASSGDVTIAANGNDLHSGNKSVTVSGAAAGGNDVAAPSSLTLTLADDETLPTLALALSSSSISETGGAATVTATLSGKSSEAVTVTVSALPGTGAAAADFDLSAANTLTIAAGSTASAGTVTVTANGNTVDSPDKSVTVSGTATGGNDVAEPSSLTLTLTDDDTATLTLLLSDPISGQADTIKELATAPGSERMTTVTARLSVPASAAVTVTVSATADTNAAADDFTLSTAKTLTIAAGSTASAGTVTITAVDDRIDSIVDDAVAGKKVVVKGVLGSALTLAAPADVELLIWEDDRAALVTDPAFPRCRRAPCPVWLSVAEGASDTFTVKLNSEPTTSIVVAVKSSESDEGLVSSGSGAAAASTRLTFTATNWETAQTVTLHGVVDDVVDGDDDYTLRLVPDTPDEATDAYHVIGGASARPQTVRTTDVDTAGLTVSESALTVTEGGAERTFTVKLTSKPAAAVTVTATSADGDEVQLARNAGDANARAFAASKELAFTAGDWNDAQTLRVTAVDDDRDDPANLPVAITLDAASGGDSHYGALDDETVDVTKDDNDPTPTVTLALSSSSISETGGVATVTATLSGKSDDAVTVTVAASPGTGAAAADFDLSTAKTLTIAAGSTASVGVATVTANGNDVDAPDKQVTISGTVAGGHGLLSNPSSVTLTLTDDETLPTVALALSSSSISETGGVATVTATLSAVSSEAVTVTVAAAAGSGAAAADFDLSAAKTLTIAAGGTTSAGTVTVTANGNDVHSGDKQVTVSAAAAGGNNVAAPPNVTLTLTDDETLPTVALVLSSPSISETGGVATVTATLSGKSSEAVTVTVGAAAGTGAAAADFGLSAAKTLTIAAGGTTSAGTVTVTANGNDVHSGDKSVTVSAAAAGGNNAAAPPNVTLTLTDDETLPTVALALSSPSISETGGVATVTATLSGKSSEAVTVTVGAAAGTGAAAADFDLSAAKTLTIAAGGTTSAGVVTVTANGNTVDSPNKPVTVSGMVTGGNNVAAPSSLTLTLTDDDALPTATLLLSAAAIDESGASNVTTVTARLDHGSSEPVTVTVSLSPVSSTGAVAGDYALSSTNTLTIAAGATASAGLVTVTANDNDVDAPNREVTVSGTADGGRGVADPAGKTLTIRDDDGAPGVTLSLNVASIWENVQPSAVSATLSHPSSAATTVTVTPVAGAFTAPSGAGRRIVFTAGNTTSSHTVSITSVDNDVDEPDRMVTVTATVANSQGAGSVTSATLTIRDNEATPTVTLSVNPTSISESGDTATVSATLSGKSSEPTTVTVTAQTNVYSAPSGAAGRIVIAAGDTTAAGDTVTITAADNDVDAADNAATVTATAGNGHAVGAVAGASLTIADDDTAGFAILPTTSTSSRLRTTEAGGTAAFTVALESEPTGNVELDLASSDATEGAVSPSSLTFTSTNWNTAQTVTLTGQDDAAADGNQDYQATLTVDTANTADAVYDALSAVTVYAENADDEYRLVVGEVTGQATEAGGTATFTVALLSRPAQAVTVAVTSRDSSEGRVSPSTLTFQPGSWSATRMVTVTGEDDDVDDGDVSWDVRLDPSSGDANYNALADADVSVTTTDDDGPPGVTLAVSPAAISENGGAATVRAVLSRPSGAATTVTVTGVSGAFTAPSGAAGRIVIAAGNTVNASDTVTITAVNDAVHQGGPGRQATVTATVANDRASADSTTMAVTAATLTLTDDESPPGATLALSDASIAENGGASAVSATLSRASAAATTVTVTAVSGFYTVGSDATIVIAAGDTTAASDTAAIAAVDNDVDEPDRTATVTATLANDRGAGSVTGAQLTLEDDETLPAATLALSSSSIAEAGGVTTVTATLDGKSSQALTLTVASAAGAKAAPADFSQTGTTLTIAAEATASTGRVTIRANDNMVASGSKQVTVSATSAGGNGAANPANAVLTLTDDDTPQVTLALSSSSIGENGGATTVTATLDRMSAVAVTVTVSASPGSGTDFTLSSANTLTFAANATASAGAVTITATDNDTDAPNKTVTVSGTASDNLGLANNPPSVTLTITDDDAAPGVTLSLSDASIAENGGTAAVSAALSHPSSAATTVTVTASSGFFTVPSGAAGRIVIAAGDTTAASDTVTITAVNNDVDEPNRMATVTATAANGQGAGNVTNVTLTLEDDDATPTVTLSANPMSISENGGTAAVSATLSGRSSQPTTVTVTAQANVYSVASGAGATIVVAAGQTASSDTATITAVDNAVDAADNAATVTGTAANGHGVTAAATGASLTIADDDTAGVVMDPETTTASRVRTSEDGSQATVEVTLATEPTGNVEIDVASQDTAQGTASPSSLTFTPTDWNTAQTVTLTGVDDNPGAPDGSQNYTVTLTVDTTNTADANYDALSAAAIYARNLDDEAGVEVSPTSGLSTTEGGGAATFTVRLLSEPEGVVAVPLASSDPGEGAVSPSSLTFTAGNWNTAQTVTVTGVDDDADDGDASYVIETGDPSSATAAAYDGLEAGDVDDVSVTNADDDATPTVTLALSRTVVDENPEAPAEERRTTVTARLSHPSGTATTITVESSAAGDYALSANAMLTIGAGEIASAGEVTITAVDDDVDAADKTVTVSGRAENDRAAADSTTVAVTGAELTITDDDERGFAFDPAATVAAAVGASAEYTVAPTSEPAGDVTVEIAPDDADLTVSPALLTFTAANWKTPRTVTVTAMADDDDLADAATLTHAASGGGYDGVSRALSVAVAEAGDARIVADDEAGTTIYNVNGRLVTVTVEKGAENVEITLPEDLDRAVSMAVAPLPADRVAEAAGPGFSLGRDAASRVAVDVTVAPAPPGGVRLCLPVTVGLREAAGDRDLVLLRRGEPVPGSDEVEGPDGLAIQVCADGVAAFSPFAVGYADTRPAFPDDFTLTALVFTVDEEIDPVTLRKATDGDGTRHRLLPEPLVLPPGLAFDEDGTGACRKALALCGTPTEVFAKRDYAWTATDVDGDADEVEFTIEVVSNLEEARARLAAVNESILPELSRAAWGSVVDAVAGRLESPEPGAGMAAAAAALKAQEGSQDNGEGVSWRDLVTGRTFAVGAGGAGGGGSGGAVMWGSGDRRSLSLDKAALDWSGELFSAHVGIDTPLGARLRGGVGASWFESAIEYTDRSGEAAVSGVHESRMTSVHPYLGWTGPDGARLWGTLGYGEGEIEITDAEVLDRFGVQRGDSAFMGAAVGGSVPVWSAGGLTLALKGSGEATRYTVDDNGSALAAVAVDTRRLRLAAEGSRAYALPGGGTLTPSLEAGGRWDGGDGETGAGVELGGGLEWTLPSRGLAVEARGRTLAAHAGAMEEWGASGSVRLSPDPDGRGLSFELSPQWGASESGLSRLWNEGVAGRGSPDGGAGAARLEAELGYGFRDGAGVATPYAGFGYEEDGDRRYRLGMRFELGPRFAVGLEAERKEGAIRPEHGVRFDLRLRW